MGRRMLMCVGMRMARVLVVKSIAVRVQEVKSLHIVPQVMDVKVTSAKLNV